MNVITGIKTFSTVAVIFGLGYLSGFMTAPRVQTATTISMQAPSTASKSNQNDVPNQAPVKNTPAQGFRIPLPNGSFIPAQTVPQSEISTLKHILVTDSSGKQIVIDATKQPTFFFAYWCSHCSNTLNAIAKDHVQLPLAVSTGFKPSTNLDTAMSLTANDLNQHGIHSSSPVYFSLTNIPEIQEFPTMIMPYKGKIIEITGEIPDPNIWSQLLLKE